MKNEDFLSDSVTQILFHQSHDEGDVIKDDELIELTAYGLSVGNEMGQPLVLLKSLKHDLTLPIPINPLEAGITLAQSNRAMAPVSPHKATAALLKAMSMRIDKCVFVEIKSSAQYVKLFVSGHPKLRSLKVKVEDVLSLCLYLEVPLFATREFIARSRILIAELDDQRRVALNHLDPNDKGHPYIN